MVVPVGSVILRKIESQDSVLRSQDGLWLQGYTHEDGGKSRGGKGEGDVELCEHSGVAERVTSDDCLGKECVCTGLEDVEDTLDSEQDKDDSKHDVWWASRKTRDRSELQLVTNVTHLVLFWTRTRAHECWSSLHPHGGVQGGEGTCIKRRAAALTHIVHCPPSTQQGSPLMA